MAAKFEYYNTGDNTVAGIQGIYWRAQSFIPSISHKITSVKFKLYRTNSPGTLTVGIRATDENGEPTGEDLCSGTTNSNTLTHLSPGEWREITLGAGYNLAASTKYAAVLRAIDGDATNVVYWRADGTSPTYSGGSLLVSSSSGDAWGDILTEDMMFEEWGTREGPLPIHYVMD